MVSAKGKILKIVLWLFIVLSFCFAVFTIIRILLTFELHDFGIYYRGIQNIISGKNPYTINPGEVIYPPITLLLLSPLIYFDQNKAENVWTIISLISLLLSIGCILHVVQGKIVMRNYLLIFGLSMLSFPVKWNLGMGQINLVLLLFICASFYSYYKNKQVLSGSLLGLASAIKFIPLPLFIFYFRKQQYRIVISGLIVFIVLQLIPWLIIRNEINFNYWQQVFPHLSTVGNIAYYNQALTGWLARIGTPVPIAKWINYAIFTGLLWGAWKVTSYTSLSFPRRRKSMLEINYNQKVAKKFIAIELLEFGLLITAILIGAGLAWQYYFVLMLIPFTPLLLEGLKLFNKLYSFANKNSYNTTKLSAEKRHLVKANKSFGAYTTILKLFKQSSIKWYLLMTLIAYLLISWNIKHPENFIGITSLLLSHVLYGAILLYGVIWLILYKKKF